MEAPSLNDLAVDGTFNTTKQPTVIPTARQWARAFLLTCTLSAYISYTLGKENYT